MALRADFLLAGPKPKKVPVFRFTASTPGRGKANIHSVRLVFTKSTSIEQANAN